MNGSALPSEVKDYLKATRFDLSLAAGTRLDETTNAIYMAPLRFLDQVFKVFGVVPIVEIVYTDACKSEAIVADEVASIVHDRYLGQVFQMMNRLFLYESSRETKIIYVNKLASQILSRYGFYHESIFAARCYASQRSKMDVKAKSLGREKHARYTMFQEIIVLLHEYGHLLMRKSPLVLNEGRESVLEWLKERVDTDREPVNDKLKSAGLRVNMTDEDMAGFESIKHSIKNASNCLNRHIAANEDLIEELVCDDFAINIASVYCKQEKLLDSHDAFVATVLCFLHLRTLGSMEMFCSQEEIVDWARRPTEADGNNAEGVKILGTLFQSRLHHAKNVAYEVFASDKNEVEKMHHTVITLMDNHSDELFGPSVAVMRELLYSDKVRSSYKTTSESAVLTDVAPEHQRLITAILHGIASQEPTGA